MIFINKNTHKKTFWILFALLGIIFITITLKIGPIMGGDSFTYVAWVEYIKNNDFSFINNNDSHSNRGYFYLLTVYIIYFTQIISTQYWQYVFIFLNFIIFLFIYFLIYQLILKKLNNHFLNFFSFFIFFINYEQFLWIRYILTDYFFYFFISLSLFSLIKINKKKYLKYSLLIFISIALSIFTRPTFVVLILIFCLKFLKYLCNILKINNYFIFLTFLSLSIFGILFMNIVLGNIFNGYFDNSSLKLIAKFYSQGLIVHQRFHTYIEVVDLNILTLLKLFIVKFIYFFIFWDQLFSFKHNILNSIAFIPTYIFLIYGLIKYKYFNFYEKNIIFNSMIYILCFAYFHSLTHIEYDWRFRLPVYLPIFLISILGFYKYLNWNYKLK